MGDKGFRNYLKIEKGSTSIDERKVEYEARFDGKWVLTTNTDLSSEEVALKYKELWRVEKVYLDIKSLLDTRPFFPQKRRQAPGPCVLQFLGSGASQGA